MGIWWGIVLLGLGLLAWVGQLIAWLSVDTAVRLGLSEAEADVEPVFWADVRGEAAWDPFVLWTLPVAGILLILNNPAWVYFGLVGGGSYLYFAGRNLTTRSMLQARGIRIGTSNNIRMAYLFTTLWGLAAIITIVMAVAALAK